MDTPGSSRLTPEQQEFYETRFGVRYHAIAENPIRPSRKLRRALKHGPGRQTITTAELQILDRQRELERALTKQLIRPL